MIGLSTMQIGLVLTGTRFDFSSSYHISHFFLSKKLIGRKYKKLRSFGAMNQPLILEVYLLITGFGLLGSQERKTSRIA